MSCSEARLDSSPALFPPPPVQVSGHSESPAVRVHLVVNNTRAPLSANLSDLLVLDDTSGLAVRDSPGNKTPDGLQAFKKEFLPGNSGAWLGQGKWEVLKIFSEHFLRMQRALDGFVFTWLRLADPLITRVAKEETIPRHLQSKSLIPLLAEVGFGDKILCNFKKKSVFIRRNFKQIVGNSEISSTSHGWLH